MTASINKKTSFIRPEKFWRELGLSAGQVAVHLGCGAGFYLTPAAKIVGSKGKVYGVDVLPDMLQEALNRAKQAGVGDITKTIRADLEHTQGSSLDNNTSDWTLVANILYQADPEKILTEAKRITKKNGVIIVIEWDTASTPVGPPPETRVSLKQVKEIAARLKLIVLKQFNPSPYHFGLLFKKTS